MQNAPRAPQRLSPEARKLWRTLAGEYGIADEAGQVILTTALEAFDRMRAAQLRIEQDGTVTTDRFGQLKAHPLLTVERDSRSQFLAALKQLNLDVEPLADRAGRPAGGSKAPFRFPGDS